MKYVSCKEEAEKKVLSLYPEFKSKSRIGDNSGWCNYALVVDDTILFRFPKNEKAFLAIERECRVLDKLSKRLPKNITVPEYIYKDLEGDYPFVGYKMIKGTFLTDRVYAELSPGEKKNVAMLLRQFLQILHSLDTSDLGLEFISPKDEFNTLYQEVKRVAYPFFTEEEKETTDHLFLNYFNDARMQQFKPSVIHCDLSDDHILITPDGIGIIDFGDVRVFDPACDYIFAYFMDKELYHTLLAPITDKEEYQYRMENFYYQRTPFYGILYSIKMDTDEGFQKSMGFFHYVFNKNKN